MLIHAVDRQHILRLCALANEPERFRYGVADRAYGLDPLGEILLSAERLLRALVPDAVVVRLGGIYGPGRTRLIDGVRSGELRIRAGEHFTNRIHRDDAAGVLERLALIDAPRHDCYLAVDDEPADEAEVLRYLAERMGVPEPRPYEPGTEPPPRAGSKRCRNARIRAEGYSFEYPSFREGYAAMLD